MNQFLTNIQVYLEKRPILLWVVIVFLGVFTFVQIMKIGESIGKVIDYLNH